MRKLVSCFIIIGTLLFSNATSANSNSNILFSLQRHTLIEGEKSISIGLRNSESIPYLVQSSVGWLDESTGVKELKKATKVPFIITPPLHKLASGNYYEWRVLFTGNTSDFPVDRESVYIAKFLLIPPSEEKKKSQNMDLAVMRSFAFKVYYRPKVLKDLLIENQQDKLSFKRVDDKLIVTNNSPLYMAFDEVKVGNVSVKESELFKPLIPFSEQVFSLPSNTPVSKTVEWNLLDETSFSLEKKTSQL
ncbi:molecular chaperone [Providencia manganoxydans]|uniref:fimbrial biogenesis chaperone n=1 Tax=Providencia TaxID=586 RepID=UPI00300C3DB3